MTRLLLLFFLLLLVGRVSAQINIEHHSYEDSLLYVIDGVKQRGVKQIPDTSDMVELSTYKTGDAAYKKYGNDARYGVVIIITKKYAIESYQKKLSEISNLYKLYLERDKEKDNPFSVSSIYYIDGKELKGSQKNIATILYSLKKESIASLIMDSDFEGSYAPTKHYKIFITTKK